MRLTARQELFVHEYLRDMNATQAAIRAGFSEKSAAVQASRLLRNDNIQTTLQAAWRDKIRRADISADDVLRLITRAAFARLDDFVDWNQPEDPQVGEGFGVRIKSPDELGVDTELLTEISEEIRDLPSGIRERSRKVKLVNKEQMISLLAKHFGIGTKVDVNLAVSLPDVLKRSAAIARESVIDPEEDES